MDCKAATAANLLLRLRAQMGVTHVFTNLGSDHPTFIEAFAGLSEQGGPIPRVIVCPNEMTALSALHGYAMITRRAQLVLVHVEVGTQNLGCSVPNAARGRIPAIIVAGLSPVTDRGERTGARNEFIHWTQDAQRQSDILSQYMKWTYELRAAEMVDSVLLRALRFATTMPEGPVYLTAAREVWDAPGRDHQATPAHWASPTPGAMPAEMVEALVEALRGSRRALLISSYLGRQPAAVELLAQLSSRVGIAVGEPSPQYLNFPGDQPNHVGYRRNTLVPEADLIILMDVDVPWMPQTVSPASGAIIFQVDADPLKQGLGYWHFPAQCSCAADSRKVLQQLLTALGDEPVPGRDQRCQWIAQARARQSRQVPRAGGAITTEELTQAVRELVTPGTVVLCEEPSGTEIIPGVLRLSRPGSFYASGGSGLGWGINAALGAKLAQPDAEVISLVGDSCYLFGLPSSAYWVGRAYGVAQLTIIYNNGGWHSPKLSTLGVHPEGRARHNDTYWVTIGAQPRLAAIAEAAGGAVAFHVNERTQLQATLAQAIAAVRAGNSAVVDVALVLVSGQVLG